MRAAIVTKVGSPLDIVDMDDPAPDDDGVVIHVDACGICGSDLHLSDTWAQPGLVLGHEFCGTVVALGKDVGDWREGDRAAGLSISTCGQCLACRDGRPRQCEARLLIGADTQGSFAEFARVKAHDLVRLPDSLDHQAGALIEPLAIGLHTVERANVTPGEDVLVVGAGPIGAAVAVWLQHLGASEVVVSDPVEHRRDLVASLGATLTVDPTSDDVAGAFHDLTGHAPSIVIECVGIPGLIAQSCDLAGDSARVVIAGVCMQQDSWIPVLPMMKELDLRFAIYYRRKDWEHTVTMIERGRLEPRPLVTSEITMDELPARFEALKSPTTDCKILVRP